MGKLDLSSHIKLFYAYFWFSIDGHWRPITMNCDFCTVDYDVILHLENISQEAPFVFQKIAGLCFIGYSCKVSIMMTFKVGLENQIFKNVW